jgi:hypothetical protein
MSPRRRHATITVPPADGWYAAGWSEEISPVTKLKNEAELFKAALAAGVQYAERERKAVQFEAGDSNADKALYVYRLLVHDKLLAPMPEAQVSQKSIRLRLARWYAKQLPEDHPLLK